MNHFQNLECDPREYWVVKADFSDDIFRIFKSRKSARQYLTDIKYKIINNCKDIFYDSVERTEDKIELCFTHKKSGEKVGWYFVGMVKVEK